MTKKVRTKLQVSHTRALQMKQKAFVIIVKGDSLTQINPTLLKSENLTLGRSFVNSSIVISELGITFNAEYISNKLQHHRFLAFTFEKHFHHLKHLKV